MSLWTRPRWWTWPRAAAMPMARRKKLPTSMGAPSRPLERLAARILEHQHGPPLVLRRAQAAARPRRGRARPAARTRARAAAGWPGEACSPTGATTSSAGRHGPVGVGRWPRYRIARALLVERLEHVGGKVDHGGLLCHTRACSAGAEAPGARRTAGAATPTAPGEPGPDDSPC